MIATHTEQETLLERICADMPAMPDAACRVDPELFFVFETERGQIADAKKLCGTCPELDTCRAWVLANPQSYGVWAGMTESERSKIRRRNQPARRRRRT